MAAIAAANVALTIQGKGSITDAGNKSKLIKVVFGDGALTYPAGGVPLSGLSTMGFPTAIATVNLMDPGSANGFVYKYDSVNNKLRIYQGDNTNVAAAPLIELSGSAAPAAATLYVSVSGY